MEKLDKEENTVQEVVYSKAKKRNRFLAFFTDGFIFIVSTFILFGALHMAVRTMPFFVEQSSIRQEIRLDSGLYVYNKNNDVVSIVDYLNDNTEYPNAKTKKDYLAPRIETFYINERFFSDKSVLNKYDERRLTAKRESTNLFIKNDGKIVENSVNPQYLYDFYKNEITSYSNGMLLTLPEYSKTTSVIFMTAVIEVIIYGTLMFALFYVVLPLTAFRRGRRTLGRAIFKVGLVGLDALNIRWKKFVLRQLFAYVFLVLLDFFAFLIPLIISIFMVLFSKQNQGLVDYVFGIHQVDITVDDIYFDYGDYEIRKGLRKVASIENNDFKIGSKHI